MKKCDKVLINTRAETSNGLYKCPKDLFQTRSYDFDANPKSSHLLTKYIDLGLMLSTRFCCKGWS